MPKKMMPPDYHSAAVLRGMLNSSALQEVTTSCRQIELGSAAALLDRSNIPEQL